MGLRYGTEEATEFSEQVHKTIALEALSLIHIYLPQLTGKLNTIADNFIAISDNLEGIDYASTFNKIDSTLYLSLIHI